VSCPKLHRSFLQEHKSSIKNKAIAEAATGTEEHRENRMGTKSISETKTRHESQQPSLELPNPASSTTYDTTSKSTAQNNNNNKEKQT
jgi:hypothetical protein